MNQLAIQTKVLSQLQNLDNDQLQDVMQYIGNVTPKAKKDNYRRKAIMEIRSALSNL